MDAELLLQFREHGAVSNLATDDAFAITTEAEDSREPPVGTSRKRVHSPSTPSSQLRSSRRFDKQHGGTPSSVGGPDDGYVAEAAIAVAALAGSGYRLRDRRQIAHPRHDVLASPAGSMGIEESPVPASKF
jgi:hypothetical protein